MSKADNNNNYDSNPQALDGKQTGWKQYIILGTEVWIRCLVTEFGSEV